MDYHILSKNKKPFRITKENYFISTKLPHAYVQYVSIVNVKYWINFSTALVGIDWL